MTCSRNGKLYNLEIIVPVIICNRNKSKITVENQFKTQYWLLEKTNFNKFVYFFSFDETNVNQMPKRARSEKPDWNPSHVSRHCILRIRNFYFVIQRKSTFPKFQEK